jgi:polyisoprenoid-binding protein YceI
MTMKKRPGAVFPALLLILSWMVIPGIEAEESNQQKSWVMDLSHADVSFSVRVLGIFAISGEFERLHGGLVFNDSCHATNITFNIDSASVTTRDTALDRVLRSPALLNTENFPAITFASNRIVLHRDDPGLITGQLVLNGVTREVSFVLKHNPGSLDVALATASRLEATVTISRKAFGITALPVAVSDNIDITVTMSARPEYITLADARNQDNL